MKKIVIIMTCLMIFLSLTGCMSKEAEAVYNKIEDIGTITENSKTYLDEIKNDYDLLTNDQKQEVDNFDKYEKACEIFDKLITEKAQEVASNINNDTFYSESKIQGILNLYYDFMTDDNKIICLCQLAKARTRQDVIDRIQPTLSSPSTFSPYASDIKSTSSYDKQNNKYTIHATIKYNMNDSNGNIVKGIISGYISYMFDLQEKNVYVVDINIDD